LEDVEQDSQAGRLTVYSEQVGNESLDALANRTFHFGRKVLMGLDCFEVEDSTCELIHHGANLLLIDTISRTDCYYTGSYLRELEAHSPFSFSFLNKQRNDFFQRHGSLMRLMETAMLFQS
jgi:hypothetical protein